MTWIRHRWKWLLAALMALVAIGVVGIPYVYIHFFNKPAPRLTFENLDKQRATSTDATGSGAVETTGAAASDSGTWIVVSPSTAGYRAKETLSGQSTEAVGRTNSIEGSFVLNETTVASGEFSVDLTSLKSDSAKRDAQVQGRLLATDEFPVATFTLTEPIELGPLPADGTAIASKAIGTLSVRGTEKPQLFDIQALRNGGVIQVLATTTIAFADYGIPDPSLPPVVSVGKTLLLEVSLTLNPGQPTS